MLREALRDSLKQGIDGGYPAARALKHLAPEELVGAIERKEYASLNEIAAALGDMGGKMKTAAPLLESALDQVPLSDLGAIESVSKAIQKIDPGYTPGNLRR